MGVMCQAAIFGESEASVKGMSTTLRTGFVIGVSFDDSFCVLTAFLVGPFEVKMVTANNIFEIKFEISKVQILC